VNILCSKNAYSFFKCCYELMIEVVNVIFWKRSAISLLSKLNKLDTGQFYLSFAMEDINYQRKSKYTLESI
jgi:hypothetical protein